MAQEITNYTCPACTGPLQFGAASGKLECEYCGSSFEVAEVEPLYAEKEAKAVAAMAAEEESGPHWDTSGLQEDWGGDEKNMKSYSCPSCGAELICDETTAATACPYCGNPTVVPGQFSGALRPDWMLPFKLRKEDAVAKLKEHYKGKRFLPDLFLDQHTIEKIQGVYVPFWLYDGTVSGSCMYAATRVHVHRRGEYEITATDHYHIHRSGSIDFERVPVDASSKMPDDYMESVEPFDYSDLVPFSTAYLPGFLADKYDVTVEQGNERADERCRKSLEDSLAASVMGYSTCMPLGKGSMNVARGKVQYALLPVWLLNVRWEGETYLFAINGQTGKVCGRLPASKKKAMAFFAKLAVPLSILGAALAFILV